MGEAAVRTGKATALLSRWGGIVLTGCLLAAPASAQDAGPRRGERVRVELEPTAVVAPGVTSPWEGTFLMFRDDALITDNPYGGAVALPLDDVESLYVERPRSRAHTIGKGALIGTAFGIGMWQMLNILCRSGCDSGSDWLPATGAGALVGLLVVVKAPGHHWVSVSLTN